MSHRGLQLLAERVQALERGRLSAHIQVQLVNDGPVTIILDVETPLRTIFPPC